MNINTDLPHQPATFQQPPLTEKKGDHSWKAFCILLVIYNLVFLWPSPLTFLLPLAIIDFIAFSASKKNHSPPWKAFFISIFAANALFFLLAWWGLNQSAGGVAGIVIVPYGLLLLIIDCIALLTYDSTRDR